MLCRRYSRYVYLHADDCQKIFFPYPDCDELPNMNSSTTEDYDMGISKIDFKIENDKLIMNIISPDDKIVKTKKLKLKNNLEEANNVK